MSKDIRTVIVGMKVGGEEMDEGEEAEVEQDIAEAEEGGLGKGLLELEAAGILTQDDEPGGTTLVDAHNGFNELSRLETLWTVRHLWPAGAKFAFNFYTHWGQLLLSQPGDALVILLSQ